MRATRSSCTGSASRRRARNTARRFSEPGARSPGDSAAGSNFAFSAASMRAASPLAFGRAPCARRAGTMSTTPSPNAPSPRSGSFAGSGTFTPRSPRNVHAAHPQKLPGAALYAAFRHSMQRALFFGRSLRSSANSAMSADCRSSGESPFCGRERSEFTNARPLVPLPVAAKEARAAHVVLPVAASLQSAGASRASGCGNGRQHRNPTFCSTVHGQPFENSPKSVGGSEMIPPSKRTVNPRANPRRKTVTCQSKHPCTMKIRMPYHENPHAMEIYGAISSKSKIAGFWYCKRGGMSVYYPLALYKECHTP